MINLYNQIKWAYQRVVKGYDDRIMWQFDSYFIRIIPALKEFCIEKLQEEKYIKLNEERCKIYSKTLDLIESYEQAQINQWENIETYFNTALRQEGEAVAALAEYFGKHINWYWS